MYTKELNIYERMSFVENELPPIAKGMEIGTGKNAYKAVGEADVLNTVKPLEFKYRIKSLPIKREVMTQNCYETKLEGYTKRLFYISIKTTFRFINLDNPSDYVDVESLGDGTDPLDKASGKAQTYADKFALLKAYKAITGEDTDNIHSDKDEDEQRKAYKKYGEPKKISSSNDYANLNEEQARQKAIKDGKANLIKSLDKKENSSYKDEVLKSVCGIYEVKSWDDITFRTTEEYTKLTNIVKQELQKEKDLAKAGI